MKQVLNLQLKYSEDRVCLWYALGLLLFFLGYLLMIFWTVYSFMNHPHAVSPSQVGSGYLAYRMHRKVIRFTKSKLIVRR